MKLGMAMVWTALLANPAWAEDNARIKALEDKVTSLEKRIAALEPAAVPVVEKLSPGQAVGKQRQKAKARIAKDLSVYSPVELREIESLYQVANQEWKTQRGKDSLKLLAEKFDRANRTGCALLYLAQMSKGDEREEYLEEAMEDFSDCYYENGVQVGAYARFLLAYHYKETGEEDDAEDLLEEIKKHYPDAVSHNGELLVDLIEKSK